MAFDWSLKGSHKKRWIMAFFQGLYILQQRSQGYKDGFIHLQMDQLYSQPLGLLLAFHGWPIHRSQYYQWWFLIGALGGILHHKALVLEQFFKCGINSHLSFSFIGSLWTHIFLRSPEMMSTVLAYLSGRGCLPDTVIIRVWERVMSTFRTCKELNNKHIGVSPLTNICSLSKKLN